jgi:hypothetical protein
MIDDLLERGARAPALFIQKPGHIVIEGKRSAHIMMIHI